MEYELNTLLEVYGNQFAINFSLLLKIVDPVHKIASYFFIMRNYLDLDAHAKHRPIRTRNPA